jgi:hypothetical protein
LCRGAVKRRLNMAWRRGGRRVAVGGGCARVWLKRGVVVGMAVVVVVCAARSGMNGHGQPRA